MKRTEIDRCPHVISTSAIKHYVGKGIMCSKYMGLSVRVIICSALYFLQCICMCRCLFLLDDLCSSCLVLSCAQIHAHVVLIHTDFLFLFGQGINGITGLKNIQSYLATDVGCQLDTGIVFCSYSYAIIILALLLVHKRWNNNEIRGHHKYEN